jgi:hypothetical protein
LPDTGKVNAEVLYNCMVDVDSVEDTKEVYRASLRLLKRHGVDPSTITLPEEEK